MSKSSYKANITMKEINKTFKHDDVKVMTLNIKYPKVSIEHNSYSEHLINNQITMNVNGYVKYTDYLHEQAIKTYIDSQTDGFPFHPYEAYMKYNIAYNENCFLSVYIDKYEFTGGAHGSTVRSSDTWELSSGTNIPLYTFFKRGTDYERLLTEEIIKQAEYNMKQNPGIYFDDYKNLILKNFNQQNFYLTPQGLVIYYQQYDIAPYSTGIVEFTIPYKTIGWYPKC